MPGDRGLLLLPASLLVVAGCSTPDRHEYPSDYHQYGVLESFRAPAIQEIAGRSYRLTWHAWHKKPGLIRATCEVDSCELELRFTDGYGTYTQGKLAGVRTTGISRDEFDAIEQAFAEGDFASFDPDLRDGEPYAGVVDQAEEGAIPICIHAPSYYLESYDGERHKIVYRYCQSDYGDALGIARPLVELSARYFPEETALVSAEWIAGEMEVAEETASN